VSINLIRKHEVVVKDDFHPSFTYQIFGDEEKIVGYKEPAIQILFHAHDLKPHAKISYKQKIKPDTEEVEKLMDIKGQLKPFLPAGCISGTQFTEASASASWKPPGEVKRSYTANGARYEIWCASLLDPQAKEILSNMRIFIPFYIEGGTCTFLDDPNWSLERWKLWLVYEISSNDVPDSPPYILAGFATSYRIWTGPSEANFSALTHREPPTYTIEPDQIPDPGPKETPSLSRITKEYFTPDNPDFYDPIFSPPSRERISQFIILPPWQGQSHGANLYNTMTKLFLHDPSVFEITVEDPNEAFDDLRYHCDLLRLYQDPSFTSLRLPDTLSADALKPDAPVPTSSLLLSTKPLENLRHKYKIAPRQFATLVEIHLLSTIPPRHRSVTRIIRKERSAEKYDRQYYFWRLLVKERVYKRNRDQLVQLDEGDRIEKLDATLPGLQTEYERVLEEFGRIARKVGLKGVDGGIAANGNGEGAEMRSLDGKRKRKVVVEDEDEDEGESSDAKRRK
jgi:histone acetyltransferase 1